MEQQVHATGYKKRLFEYLQQRWTEHMLYVSLLPRWRHPLFGYLVGVLAVSISLMVGVIEMQWLFQFSFPGLLLLSSIIVIALLWGVGPAIFTVFFGLLVLDYLYIPPVQKLGIYDSSGFMQICTFALSGIAIALLAHQRERTLTNAYLAQKKQAQHLAIAFDTVLESKRLLRETNQQMETQLSVICHELKSPLTVIKGSVQLATQKVQRVVTQQPSADDLALHLAPVQTLLEQAKNQVNHQNRLINDLLDAARIQADTLTFIFEAHNLQTIVEEAVENQRLIVPSRTIYLQTSTTNEVPVHVDADRIRQVIGNYLTNAIKYSPPDQPVTVGLYVKQQVAYVIVKDEGPGLSQAEQERIWQRFYRVQGIEVQEECSALRGNLGVGLSICKTIVEKHSGRVGVWSIPGQGSSFWFTLQLHKQP